MTKITISGQIDHVDAAIIGIQHGIELNNSRKRPDDMNGLREMKLHGWNAVKATLEIVQEFEPEIRDLIKSKRGEA